MRQYLELLQHILDHGVEKGDRTGTGTLSVFGYQIRFDLQEGFPLITTKKIPIRLIIHELLWFLQGNTNTKYLLDNNVHIWDEWADKNGELGPVYGFQWRSWPNWIPLEIAHPLLNFTVTKIENHPIDQITQVIERIKSKPNDRRLIVTAWNPADVPKMALPPCHLLFQFYVADNKLSCQMYQRSCDTFLGVPFNIASYALLTMMVAQVAGYQAGEFIWVGGDTHLYLNHLEQARLQLTREPRPLPKMILNPDIASIFDFKYEDFILQGYNPHPHIKAEVAV